MLSKVAPGKPGKHPKPTGQWTLAPYPATMEINLGDRAAGLKNNFSGVLPWLKPFGTKTPFKRLINRAYLFFRPRPIYASLQ
jgi:hypothetical protein